MYYFYKQITDQQIPTGWGEEREAKDIRVYRILMQMDNTHVKWSHSEVIKNNVTTIFKWQSFIKVYMILCGDGKEKQYFFVYAGHHVN